MPKPIHLRAKRGRPQKEESERRKQAKAAAMKAERLQRKREKQVTVIRKMLATRKKKEEARLKLEEAMQRPARVKTGLKRSDPAFFKRIGGIGGRRTKINMLKADSDYYAKIAIISHQVIRENKAAAEEEAEIQALATQNSRAQSRGRR
jgi:hypothetical protein